MRTLASPRRRPVRQLSATLVTLVLSACAGTRATVTHPGIPVAPAIALAADVILPTRVPPGGVPVILIQTRYWRSFRLIGGGGGGRVPQGPRESIVSRLIEAGFGVVVTDVRGTGASDGQWRWPWSSDEVADMGAIIDWIVKQPWSNGAVGATGVSYEGTTALLAAAAGRPALKAVLARQLEWELTDETIAPGGVRNVAFPDVWGRSVDALDHGAWPEIFPSYAKWFVRGVQRRDTDPNGAALAALQHARAPSSNVAQRAAAVHRGSDPFGPGAPAADSLGPAGHVPALAGTTAIVAIWGSWWDGGTADAVFRAQRAMPIREAIIGPWDHDGAATASPLRTASSDRPTVDLDSVVGFFRRHVTSTASGTADTARIVRWYVAGAEQWRRGATWPATRPRTWRLAGERLLDGEHAAPLPSDTLRTLDVDFTASTGRNTRWTTGLVRPVDAPDRARAPGLLSWRTAPFSEPLAVFGDGALTCNVTLSADEAALHVYLESVDASGRVRLLTEGTQRARAGAITVRIRPVAFELPSGWSLRLSIAGADAPTFERVPATGPQRIIMHGASCTLVLPVSDEGVSGPR
jgi:putative CocE/NonD family hydrolase